ncbi:unnamed protein product [Linum tenue]|uniref:Regulator of telomere elongation helicase 1 homolog n=1 Tax=Linum tenue TaxID=586396 RepID=A0AAV0HA68_9ROSI|nr:unnamed protein product [Linum tenue]
MVAQHQSPPSANQNPSSSSSKRAYHVGGISVEFPYQPYGTQLAFMGRVISTLERAQREGHCHALLESPTGTGKSLSLLCSTLAWQQTQKLKNQYANLTLSEPDPEAMIYPNPIIGHGGGFVPETKPSRNLLAGVTESTSQAAPSSKAQQMKLAPTIFYASRTHSQISQVVREYRKTGYRVPMAILASRKRYCTNETVNRSGNIDEKCKLLTKNPEGGCSYFKNVEKLKDHASLQKGGCHEVHDIEDLVKVGNVVEGCPYYAARLMAEKAQLVFCPYSYVINPIVRRAMDIDIQGAILVLDEAHNIEDIARDAVSVDLNEDALQKLQTELRQVCSGDAMIYQPLYKMTQDLLSWMERKKSKLEMREFQQFYSCWTGDQALRELQEANITQLSFPILLDCAQKTIKDATVKEAKFALLSGMSVTTLEGLFSALKYFFSRNGSHISDYQLAVQRTVKKDTKNVVTGWTHTFSLWCLNPAVVFKEITDLSLSVILTSGTLSPMNSFPSELGVNFGTCIEAPHVVNIKSQVWTAVISSSYEKYPLNASYKTASTFAFQDALGKSLEEILKVVPAGSLVFFPSYSMMGKLCKRWQETGQWSKLHAQKSLFVEPRGGNQEEFDSLLKGYYKSVSGSEKVPDRTKKGNKKADIKKNGGAFLAVCRGKVSEGIDFSDDNARVVIIVGIPFPNINDVKVHLKKKYNDTFKSTKNLISGNEWYCHQAFRALNQAAGRCIRHKNDYGAIILLDERYQEERNLAYISKWLRKSIQHHDSFDDALEGLKRFFNDAKAAVAINTPSPLLNFVVKEEKDITKDQDNRCTGESNNRWSKLSCCGQKLVAAPKCSPSANFDSKGEVKPIIIEDDSESCNVIDLDCDSPKATRLAEASESLDLEVTVVGETPELVCNGTPATGSPEPSSTTAMDYGLSKIQASTEITTPNEVTYRVQGSSICSPEKIFRISTFSPKPEADAPTVPSVNSHIQIRRKLMDSTLFTPKQESDCGNTTNSGCVSLTRSHFSDTNSSGRKQQPVSFGPAVEKRLRISCLLCKKPLGRPENDLYIGCLSTSSSKVHLLSLAKQVLESQAETISTSVPLVQADILSVDHHLCNSIRDDVPSKGIWSEEDGCVFKSVSCPFCSQPHCLGVQVMATDASNVELLNKILLFYDRLEIQTVGALGDKASKNNNHVRKNGCVGKPAAPAPIERFSFSPQQQAWWLEECKAESTEEEAKAIKGKG